MLKIKQIMILLRATFWFIPSIIVIFSIVLAAALIEVDSVSTYDWANEWPRLFGAGAEGSRGMLSTIAGSIMTMMGVTFSMTLVTLALASSQYTSRILRNFIRDRATQTSLGIFAGVFTYCLIVLRAIRGGESDFVPSLSIFTGFAMALLGVGVLVFFIHHVASSIQVSNIISSIAQETIVSMKNLLTNVMKEKSDEVSFEVDCIGWTEVSANKDGYIQTLNEEKLLQMAQKLNRKIKVEFVPGDFVVYESPLVFVEGSSEISESDILELRDSISIQRYRTIEQDALFGIRQIVDIGLKALSPGVNDTTTAVISVDYLTSTLSYLIRKEFPPGAIYHENELRVIVKRRTFNEFLVEAFSQIRIAAVGNRAVLERIMYSLGTLSRLCPDEPRKNSLLIQVDKILEEVSHTFSIPSERTELLERLSIFKKEMF